MKEIKHLNTRFLVLVTLISQISLTMAASVFTVSLNSGGESFFSGFSSADAAVDLFDEASLKATFPAYTDPSDGVGLGSALTSVLDFRGLPFELSYGATQTALVVNIPALGITETFSGTTRDESNQLFTDYIKGTGGKFNAILKELVRVSPVDPVAGNPESLQSTLAADDFSMAMNMDLTELYTIPDAKALLDKTMAPISKSSESEGSQSSHAFGLNASHGENEMAGLKVTSDTFVMNYSYRFESDPQKTIKARLPLTVIDTEGAKSYKGSLALNFSYPVTKQWVLTPAFSYGMGSSKDLAGGATINGLSITSSYRFIAGDYLFNIGNMIGKYESGSITVDDNDLDPGISNTIYRNGLVILKPMVAFNLPAMAQAFIIDTQFKGDDLYSEHYREFGFSFGLISSSDLFASGNLNLGLSYLDVVDADIDGYKINFGYKF